MMMRNLFITIFSMLICISQPVFSQTADYKSSDWMQAHLKGILADKWIKENKNEPNFNVALSANVACPSGAWRANYGYENKKQAFKSLQEKVVEDIKERLAGYPTSTIKTCSKIELIIDNGKITNHPANKKYYSSSQASLLIIPKGTKTGKIARAFIKNDYVTAMTGGEVFSENLEKRCGFKFLSKTKLTLDCGKLGSGLAAFKVTNVFKGEFSLFAELENVTFLASNMSPEKLKQKYPKLIE